MRWSWMLWACYAVKTQECSITYWGHQFLQAYNHQTGMLGCPPEGVSCSKDIAFDRQGNSYIEVLLVFCTSAQDFVMLCCISLKHIAILVDPCSQSSSLHIFLARCTSQTCVRLVRLSFASNFRQYQGAAGYRLQDESVRRCATLKRYGDGLHWV